MQEQFQYPGQELELFRHAENWKTYFSGKIKKHIAGNVLELGAGIGGTTPYLFHENVTGWTLAEPDMDMFLILQKQLAEQKLPSKCTVVNGTIDSVPGNYDTILYIDVLEHIREDADELSKAAAKLNTGGRIIVLSPAFPLLYSPFDKELGHFRRYNRSQLKKITPAALQLTSLQYLDTMGFIAGFMNKILLRQKYPTKSQVKFWDKMLVPLSRVIDQISMHSFGKTIIGVWTFK